MTKGSIIVGAGTGHLGILCPSPSPRKTTRSLWPRETQASSNGWRARPARPVVSPTPVSPAKRTFLMERCFRSLLPPVPGGSSGCGGSSINRRRCRGLRQEMSGHRGVNASHLTPATYVRQSEAARNRHKHLIPCGDRDLNVVAPGTRPWTCRAYGFGSSRHGRTSRGPPPMRKIINETARRSWHVAPSLS